MSIVVIGVDGGDSTGVGVLKDTKLFMTNQGAPGDMLTLVELTVANFHTGDDENSVHIVGERFVAMSNRARTHQPVAQQVNGALEHIAAHHGVTFDLQGPAEAHAVAPNETLKRLGMYQTPDMVGQPDASDANMAVRHALAFLSRRYATLFQRILRDHGVTS